MLKEMLNNQIIIKEEASCWKDAVKTSASPLLKNNLIEGRYVDSMINNIVENGPYMIIVPGVAMPHSRPEDGVKGRGISLLKLDNPVSFPEGNDVHLVFALAATDSNSHSDTIMALCDLFEDEDKINSIIEANSVDEILRII